MVKATRVYWPSVSNTNQLVLNAWVELLPPSFPFTDQETYWDSVTQQKNANSQRPKITLTKEDSEEVNGEEDNDGGANEETNDGEDSEETNDGEANEEADDGEDNEEESRQLSPAF